jgi:hypothetical protein
MNPQDFHSLFQQTQSECSLLATIKRGEYASNPNVDVLSNFKDAGKRQGLIPEKVLMVYLDKHFAGISNYVTDLAEGRSRPRSESIIGRLHDLIVYTNLLKALLAERDEMADAVRSEGARSLQWPDDGEEQ